MRTLGQLAQLGATAAVIAAATLAAACTGVTFGENGPGGDGDGDGPSTGTFLGAGSIAVDGATETSFVLTEQRSPGGTVSNLLKAVRADSGPRPSPT